MNKDEFLALYQEQASLAAKASFSERTLSKLVSNYWDKRKNVDPFLDRNNRTQYKKYEYDIDWKASGLSWFYLDSFKVEQDNTQLRLYLVYPAHASCCSDEETEIVIPFSDLFEDLDVTRQRLHAKVEALIADFEAEKARLEQLHQDSLVEKEMTLLAELERKYR